MIAVIGAGPAGLALGYTLKRAGLAFYILEREAPGASWRHHYDHLRLHSLKQVSALPGLAMPTAYPDFPTGAQFGRYLEDYAVHFELPIEHAEVCAARYEGGRWRLETEAKTFTADVLIAATGILGTPRVPVLPGLETFPGRVLHGRDYSNPDPFRGERVLVVGAGNTAKDIALALAEVGAEVGVVVRHGLLMVPYPRSALSMRAAGLLFRRVPRSVGNALLGTVRKDFRHLGLPLPPGEPLDSYPVVGFELAEAVSTGRVRVHGAVTRIDGTTVHFHNDTDNDTALPYDTLIFATGYRPTLDVLGTAVARDRRGRPVLVGARSSIHRALYCIGFYYPTTEAWLQGIAREARRAVRQVRREHPHLTPARALIRPESAGLPQGQVRHD